MAALGLCYCKRAFSGCGEQGLLSSCGTEAPVPLGVWNLPGPGIESVSPALAGKFLTTGPPGRSQICVLKASLWL